MNFSIVALLLLVLMSTVGRSRGFYCMKDVMKSHNISSNQEKLIQDMLCDYDSYNRPVKDTNKIVYVKLSFQPIFFDIMEHEKIFRITGHYQESWSDSRLKWSPSKYGSLTDFKTSYYDIWAPRITSYDTGMAYRYIDEMDKHRFDDAVINYNGTVILRSTSNLYGPCKSDTQAWPFEEWACTFTLAKTSDDEDKVQVEDFDPQVNIDVSSFLDNRAWKITSDPPFSLSHAYPGMIEISVTVQRYVSHFQSMFIFPGIALLTLSLISFWLTNRIYCRMLLNTMTTLVQLAFLQRMYNMLGGDGANGIILHDFFLDTMFTSFIGMLFAVVNAKFITKSTDPPQYLTEIIGIVAVIPVIGPVFSFFIYEDMNGTTTVEDDEVGLVSGQDAKGSQKWRLISNFMDKCAFIVIVLYFFFFHLLRVLF